MLNKNRLRKLDIQDIAIFLSLLETSNTRQTAQHLNISQPTVSYCLKRLRESFDDPLFQSNNNRFIATAKAQRIAPYLQNIIDAINYCTEPDQLPVYPVSTRPIQIYALEYFELLLLPELLTRALDSAITPGIHLQRIMLELPIEQLIAGDVDMAFGGGPAYHRLHPGLQWQSLFTDDFVCLSPGKQAGRLSLDDYCSALHLFPTPWISQSNMIDGWLESIGRSRQIVARATSYQACINSLSHSPLMLTLPRRLLPTLAIPPHIAIHEAPTGCPGFTIDMIWATHARHPAAINWLKRQMLEIAGKLPESVN